MQEVFDRCDKFYKRNPKNTAAKKRINPKREINWFKVRIEIQKLAMMMKDHNLTPEDFVNFKVISTFPYEKPHG